MSLSMSRLIATSLISRLPSPHSTSFGFNPNFHAPLLKNKNPYNPMLRIARRSLVVSSSMTPPPGLPLPSGSPSGSMRNWVLGIVITFVLPFFTHKWGPLLVLKNKVDTVVHTAEYLLETIEVVAEKVDDVIDSITDDLPEDSKLKTSLESLDALVEGVAKSARIANDLIDKVEEVEDRLESLILDEANKDEAISKQVTEKMHNNANQKPKVE